MKFKAGIDFSQFVKTQFYLTYKNKWVLLITILSLFILLVTILKLNQNWNNKTVDSMFEFRLFFMQAVLILLPLAVYIQAKRTYKTNERFREDVLYEIDEGGIKFTGESFVSYLGWRKVFAIAEVKYFFLIYENSQVANFISKSTLNEESLIKLRNILKNSAVQNFTLNK